ncbi:MAG: hypothetical protein ABFD83_13505 [Armatimonadota bacterium]
MRMLDKQKIKAHHFSRVTTDNLGEGVCSAYVPKLELLILNSSLSGPEAQEELKLRELNPTAGIRIGISNVKTQLMSTFEI